MEDRVDIPESFWERLVADKRKLAYVVGGALLVIVLLVIAGVRLLGASGPETPWPVAGSDIPSAEEPSTESSSTETSQTPSPAQEQTAAPSTGGSTEKGSIGEVVRQPWIAYRLDGAIWVAREDGKDAKKLASAEHGAFALSPDAGTLAYVDTASKRLSLVDVSSGKSVSVGTAEDADLCWAPGSQFLTYTAKSPARYEVRKVLRDGRGDGALAPGHSPRVSPGGSGFAWIADTAFGQPGYASTRMFESAAPSRYTAQTATEIAFGVDGVVMVVESAPGSSRILTAKHDPALAIDSAAVREVVGKPAGSRPGSYAHLCASPGTSGAGGSSAGRYLAYAEVGDDGYSRTYIYDSSTGRSVALSLRRDTYPLCWSADGRRLFFVEGNAFQGEPTSVMKVLPDGMGRVVVVDGGGL